MPAQHSQPDQATQDAPQTAHTTVKPHGILAKVFHWGFIAVFLYALTKQLDSVDQLVDPALLRFEVVFAIAFLVLLAGRFFYMRWAMPTALPDDTPRVMKTMARLGHLAIYGSLAMIAVSGLMIGAAYSISGASGLFMDVSLFLHETSVIAAFAMIALHIAAALFHRLKGDGIWSSMVPVWKERQK